MRLNIQTDYALRVLMHLAVTPDELIPVNTISEYYDISKNHLVKVAQSLNGLGVVKTVRGRSGGIQLSMNPEEINVGSVVRHMENDLALVECFQAERDSCQITSACRLKNILHKALTAFFDVLDQYSITDLVDDKKLVKLILKKAS